MQLKTKTLLLFFLFLTLQYNCLASIVLTTSLKRPLHTLILQSHGHRSIYEPKANVHLSLKVNFDWFFLQYGFRIPNSDLSGGNIRGHYRNLRLGIAPGPVGIEINYKRYIGFKSSEQDGPSCERCYTRESLSSYEYSLNILLALNWDFPVKRIMSGGGDEVQSDFSFFLQVDSNVLNISDPDGIVQANKVQELPSFANLNKLELRHVGPGLGLGGIWAGELWYLSYFAGAGLSLQRNKLTFNNNSFTHRHLGKFLNAKLVLSTYGKGLNVGSKGLANFNSYRLGHEESMNVINYSLYFYFKYNF